MELSDEEKLAGRLAKQLATEHHVDSATYEAAVRAFGATGLFDIVAVMGVYHTVCGAVALFEVPVPATQPQSKLKPETRLHSHSDVQQRSNFGTRAERVQVSTHTEYQLSL